MITSACAPPVRGAAWWPPCLLRTMSGEPVLEVLVDPAGRIVELTVARWVHIVLRHPEMIDQRPAIAKTIQMPDFIQPDPRPQRYRYYREGEGPSRWVRAVVGFDTESAEPGEVLTAFAQHRSPFTGEGP